MKRINFYRTRDEYGCFSNFSSHPIVINGCQYKTTEHYFQSQKFAGLAYEKLIISARSPKEAADLGRAKTHPLRGDWEKIKNDVMLMAILAKFTQHTDLLDLLLSTGESYIAEHTINDKYWGDGGDDSGQNMLGKILMHVRDSLRNIKLRIKNENI